MKRKTKSEMKSPSPIPGTAANIGDLLGSVLVVAAVIYVVWPNLVHRRRPAPVLGWKNVLRGNGDSWSRGLLRPQCARPVGGISKSGIGHWQSKASFRIAWSSGRRSLTPSPTSSGGALDDLLAGS
jgi:hypothetical protein